MEFIILSNVFINKREVISIITRVGNYHSIPIGCIMLEVYGLNLFPCHMTSTGQTFSLELCLLIKYIFRYEKLLLLQILILLKLFLPQERTEQSSL